MAMTSVAMISEDAPKAEQLRTEVVRLESENALLRDQLEELKRFRVLAMRDPLTRLRNRRCFQERMAEEIDRARRRDNYQFAVLLVDIDDFKLVNDTHGHPVGDRVLVWLAGILQNAVRDHDVCCRLGGDEFAVLLPYAGADEALAVAVRLQDSVAAKSELLGVGVGVGVSVSVGGACYPTDAEDPEVLLALADAGMYAHKRDKGPSSGRFQPAPSV